MIKVARKCIDTWRTLKHALWRCYAGLRRADVHASVIMRGRPLIRCCRGGKMVFHERVVVNSSIQSNPVIGHVKSSFSVVVPGAVLEVGAGVGMSGVTITAAKRVSIGTGTIIGADTMITDTDFHSPLPEGGWSNDARSVAEAVSIGKNCFIGARSIILKGVTIGDGAVVAAGAVVTRDVPALGLAIGNPAVNRDLPEKWKRANC